MGLTSLHRLPPLYTSPYPFVQKIANGRIYIAHDHKADGHFYFACKQVNGGKVEGQDDHSIAYGLYYRSAQGLLGVVHYRQQFLNHNASFGFGVELGDHFPLGGGVVKVRRESSIVFLILIICTFVGSFSSLINLLVVINTMEHSSANMVRLTPLE